MTVEELLVLITANSTGLKNEIGKINNKLNDFEKETTKKVNKISSLFTKLIPVGLIIAGIKKVNDFIKSSEQAYKDQIQNETRLLAVMKQLDTATKQDVKDILSLADAQQKMGVVGDEIQLAGAQELSTYVKKADSIKKLIPQMNNMIAQQYGYNATQEEAINIATMMGKVLEGQTGALSRYGYYFDENEEKILKFGTEEEKVATLTSIIHDSIGDVNEALGDTPIGRQIQLANAWGDVKEQIGYVATQIKQVLVPVFQVLVSWIGTAVSYLRQFLQVLGFTAKKQNTASKSLGVGTTAEKNYGNAVADSTKKQKQQLATFDEMNVLKENDSGSSGGGGDTADSTGLGGVNNIDFNVGIDGDVEVTEKVEKVANYIKETFSKLRETLNQVWDSQPVQAFVGFATTYGQFLFDYWSTLGTNLWENLKMTWSNIEGDVSTALTNMSLLWTAYFTDLQVGIQTWGQPIIDGVSKLFNSIWKDAVDPAIKIMSKAWADFSKILLDLWNEHGKPLIDNIGQFVTTTINLFQKIWDDVLEPIITPFLETLSWLWDKHLKGLIKNVGDFVMKLVNGALEIYNKFIAPILSWLMDKLAPAWAFLSNVIVGVLGTILGVVTDVFSAIFKILGGVIDFITGIFTGNWKKAWNGVKDIFKGIIDGLAGIFKAPINLIIDGINSFIAGINKVKIPDWVPVVGGKGFHIDKIPKLAQGGVIDKPTIAMIGEAGKEAVIPLESNTGWITELANQLNGKTNGGQPYQIIVKIGEDTILDKIVDGINQKSFENNGEVFNIWFIAET